MKAVLDSQLWLDWLVFDDPGMRFLQECVARGTMELVRDARVEAELERVLGYRLGKRSLSGEEKSRCLARFRELAKRVSPRDIPALPRCSDPDDQKFLELAAGANAELLASRDRALLALARRKLPFRIAGPEVFLERYLADTLRPRSLAALDKAPGLLMGYEFGFFLFRPAAPEKLGAAISRLAADCRSLERKQPAHAVVLVPDAAKLPGIDAERIWGFVRDAKAYLSVMDPGALVGVVREALALCAAATRAPLAPLVAFDFCMLERFNRSVEVGGTMPAREGNRGERK